MSIVPPAAPLDEPPPPALLLPLLLQPAAARAIAAKAAIAGIRLIVGLPLIDLHGPAATERPDRPVRAPQQCDSRGIKQSDHVLCVGSTLPISSGSARSRPASVPHN